MSIVDRLCKAFERIEQWDMRVGDIWLHPKQVAELEAEKNDAAYDRIAQKCVRDAFIELKGAPFVGSFLGARVFESEIVVENHVALVPSGFDAKLTGSEGCTPF